MIAKTFRVLTDFDPIAMWSCKTKQTKTFRRHSLVEFGQLPTYAQNPFLSLPAEMRIFVIGASENAVYCHGEILNILSIMCCHQYVLSSWPRHV